MSENINYADGTIRQYLDDAASAKPAPGGGSVSALAGALGASMGCMAANFTVGRKQYKDVSDEVKGMLDLMDGARARLLRLADADALAYGEYKRAQDMPKGTDAEKADRKKALQAALSGAMSVPLDVIRECLSVLRFTQRLARVGNRHLVTDVAVCAILAEAAIRGAAYNVLINTAGLEDKEEAERATREVANARAQGLRFLNDTIAAVEEVMKG
ncbi:MAG TPA: cyclodeaminase/cyclohydrolase family protein [Candidatus Brocadiia bacterium]|nr:cyclodeaminase/cyclohydrolase family protein [Candidatus Brocadiia bacterium]